MTNIEFLVNELRKANETIENLRKDNVRLRQSIKFADKRISELSRENTTLRFKENNSLGDLDALAALREKLANS